MNDEYSKSIARKGIANQLNPMIEIKDEPVPIVYEDLSTANFSIDTANGCASLAKGEKPKVDIIDDMPIDGMDFECVSLSKAKYNLKAFHHHFIIIIDLNKSPKSHRRTTNFP